VEQMLLQQRRRPKQQLPVPVMVLTCKDTRRLICEYLEEKLARGVAREFRQHLDLCKECFLLLEAARRVLEVEFDSRLRRRPKPKAQIA